MRITQPVNPYMAGAPLREERGFFGRQDTLEWVGRELRNPSTNTLVLFGQRRIGKTSLLLQLQRTLPADAFLPVYFDLQDQAARPLGQVLADLADTITEQVGLQPPAPDAFDDIGRFFRRAFLPQLYDALRENRRPVFLLDEFDVLDQVAKEELPQTVAAKTLFPLLRRVMTEDSRPAFVFVVGRLAEDLALDFTATFKASLVREIWVLDRESAEALVRQAEVNATLHFTNDTVEHILSLTSGHPYLTQLLCQRIWERAYARNPTAPPRIDIPAVDAAVLDTLEVGAQALAWLWDGLSPAEKIYLAALAQTADEGETIPEDQVIHMLTTHASRLRSREVELAPHDLVKRRVLETVGEREYRFAVELFRCWVRRNKPVHEVKDELDQVEPVADHLYDVGRDIFARRQWVDAVRYFQDALARNPRHFRARLHLGEVLLELDRVDESIAELRQAYELDREEARYTLVRALLAQARARKGWGDDDGALDACEQVLQISPDEQVAQEIRTAIWAQRGNAALKRGDLDAALAAYREAGDTRKITWVEILQRRTRETRKPLNLETLYSQAQEYLKEKKWEEAIKALEAIVSIDQAYKDAYERLKRAQAQYRLQNLYEQAIGHFREERWPQAIKDMGSIHQEDPNYRDVADRLKEAKEQQELAALYRDGVGFQETGRWKEAIDKFVEIISRVGIYKDVATRLSEVQRRQELVRRFEQGEDFLRQRKWQEAVREFEQVYRIDPNYRGVRAKLKEAKKQLHLEELHKRRGIGSRGKKWPAKLLLISFLLGFFGISVVVLSFARPLRCLVEYHISDAQGALIIGFVSGVAAILTKLLPDNIKPPLLSILGGIIVALLVILVVTVIIPPPPKEECFSTPTVTATPPSMYTPMPILINTLAPTYPSIPTLSVTPTPR